MLNFPALDVAVGVIFVYFILAIVCSGLNEAIASLGRWRAQDLERGLWELLQDPTQGSAALEKLKSHPLVEPMLYPKNKDAAAPSPPLENGRPKTSRKTDFPSYIPSRTFVTALLGFEQQAVSAAKDVDVKQKLRTVEESIEQIPSERVQQALTALLHHAQGDAVTFRHNAEQWYDDQMERVSGWYRQRIQKILWILAIVIALALNADSLQIAKRLWVEPSTRAALVTQAQSATNRTGGKTNPSLIGLSLTVVAITFGAPFWFDTLSKVARLRNSGAPPPASDAIRHGEGEETRRGDSAALATALLGAVGKSAEAEAPTETPTKPKRPPPGGRPAKP